MALRSIAVSATVFFLAVAQATAATLRTCDSDQTNAAFVVFPVAENTAEYADGLVRPVSLDTAGEPACCSFHLMVLDPSADGSYLECDLISMSPDAGFYSVFLNQATVVREDADGLSPLVVPAEGNVDGTPVPAEIAFDVDLVAGTVTVK
ncbi:MAG: hypothetical protein JNN02_08410 [Tabrizicola sp.]|nr:hypothetical protein [Tabrizicola sp.]